MSKPAIAVFSLAYRPFIGGAELAAEEIIKREQNLDFFVFTNRFDREWSVSESKDNESVHRVGYGRAGIQNYYHQFFNKLLFVFLAWFEAEKRHRERPFSAVWSIMASYAGFSALLFKLFHPTVPLLLTLQEGDSEGHILKKVGILYPLWRMIFQKADKIQVISSYLREFAKRHGAMCDIEVVPNGVNLNKFKYAKPKGKLKTPKIITMSRLVSKNGVDLLIRAIAELPSVHLSVIGEGPDRSSLEHLAALLGVVDRVEFLGNIVPDNVPEYLSSHDIFVRASRSEGLGNAFLEAMASGLPVIGTPVGGIPDFLTDEETGLFAAPEDYLDLAKKISVLVGDSGLRLKLSKNGKRLIEDRYSWEAISVRMNEIFKKLCVF